MATSVMCAGCGGDPVGFWQSREKVGPDGPRNELELQDGGSGDLEMFIAFTNQTGIVRLTFDVDDWFEESDGAYEVQLKCTSGCEHSATINHTLDFEMDCDYDTSNEWLDCEAKSPFKGYGFFEFEVEPP